MGYRSPHGAIGRRKLQRLPQDRRRIRISAGLQQTGRCLENFG
jgi:hypothetical protein